MRAMLLAISMYASIRPSATHIQKDDRHKVNLTRTLGDIPAPDINQKLASGKHLCNCMCTNHT